MYSGLLWKALYLNVEGVWVGVTVPVVLPFLSLLP